MRVRPSIVAMAVWLTATTAGAADNLVAGTAKPPSPAGIATPRPPAPARCGDGLLQAGETCASCAQDCTPRTCTPSKRQFRARIELMPPIGQQLSTAMLLLSYRNTILSLPGQGSDASTRARITSALDGGSLSVNDLGYALRLVVTKVSLSRGAVADVVFDICEGAATPTLDDLACTVEASAGIGGTASGATCRIVAP